MPPKKATLKTRKPRTKSSSVRRTTSVGEETQGQRPGLSFPVVAIGASAGGLGAFTELLKALPPKSGMAFVLIQHLEPKHESALTALLSKATSMPVVEVSEGMAVEPNCVYVIPPNKDMTIRKGTLRLAPRSAASGLQRPKEGVTVHKDGVQKVEPASPQVSREEGRKSSRAAGKKHAPEMTVRLERELTSTREHLRALIAEHETAQEEMKAAHEEILSSNEELQSTNEELETAKEELQSANEELVTLNDELQHRNDELTVLTHDLSNLLVGVDIPVLVLDADLRVRRFTPVAGGLLNLIPGDVGRPFSDLASPLDVADWPALFAEVAGRGEIVEREVRARNGHRYSMRMRPYKTNDNKIEGVLVVMLDVDLIYRARDEAQKSGDYSRAIVETIHEALVVVDSEFRVLSVNRRFCDVFRVSGQDFERQSFFGTGAGQCNVPQLRKRLRDVLAKDIEIKDFELDQEFPGIGQRRLVLSARQIRASGTILIAIEDLTEPKRARESLERSESTIRSLLASAPQSVVAVGVDGKIMFVNGNTEQMFGYPGEELMGQELQILVPDSARGRHVEHRKAYFANMQARPMGLGLDLEGRRRDGTHFPVEIALSAIETAEGRLAVAFVSDITQRKLLERAAQTHVHQVQALAASLLAAQEEERRRVSGLLHDKICQQLAALAIDMGGLAVETPATEVQERLKTLQARIVTASEATRHIAYELHPSVLDDLGLVASLKDLVKQFTAQHPDIVLDFTGAAATASIPREVASCLYRVARECLQNIAHHANAKHASIALAWQRGVLGLTITDDGVGFDPVTVEGRGGLGLIGIGERARLINGKLSIAAQPGGGTRIILQVPVPGTQV